MSEKVEKKKWKKCGTKLIPVLLFILYTCLRIMMGFAITYSYHIRYKSTQLCYTAVCADPTVWKKRCQLLLVPKVKKKRKN